MADPPSSSGRPPTGPGPRPSKPSTSPPPIPVPVSVPVPVPVPSSSVPAAPRPAFDKAISISTSAMAELEVGDSTRPFLDSAVGVVDELVEALGLEVGASLEAGAGNDSRLADLEIQLALIAWDVLDDVGDAVRHLELAEGHPLAPRLRLAVALQLGDRALLDAVATSAGGVTPAAAQQALRIDLAEAYWDRARDRRAAAEVLGAIPLPDRDAGVRHLLAVCRDDTAADTVVRADVDALRGLAATAPPDRLAEVLAELLDLGADDAAVLATAEEVRPRVLAEAAGPGRGPTTLHWLRVIDLLLAAAARADRAQLAPWLRAREALLPAESSADLERAACQLLAAIAVPDRAGAAAATELLRRHADAEERPGLTARLAALGALISSDLAGQAGVHAQLRERLGQSPGGWPIVHTWRALQLLDRAGAAADQATRVRLARQVHAALPSAESAWLLERALVATLGPAGHGAPAGLTQASTASPLAGPAPSTGSSSPPSSTPGAPHLPAAAVTDLVRLLEHLPGAGRRRAAALVERWAGELPRAIRLLREHAYRDAAAADRAGQLADLDHLARLLRRAREATALAAVYDQLARASDEPRARRAWASAAGVLLLTRGASADAERLFAELAAADPGDVTCRLALAALHRRAQAWLALVDDLEQLARVAGSGELRGRALREMAEVLARRLGEPARARQVLEAAAADRPDDAHILRGLATILDGEEDWDGAVALRRRVVELLDAPHEQAEVLVEIGRVEQVRGAHGAALAAFEEAARRDPRSADALRGQADVHRQAGRAEQVALALRGELSRVVDAGRRVAIRLELAELAAADADAGPALAAYREVLATEPSHPAALAGLIRLARERGHWAELIAPLRAAERTPDRLGVLAEAHERLGQWPELIEVRKAQLESSRAPADRAGGAMALAALYEHKRADLTLALGAVQLAYQIAPSAEVERELIRLLEATGRHAELAAVLERDLASLGAGGDRARRVALLMRLAALRAGPLERAGDALAAYEQVLELDPAHRPALDALAEAYQRLGRDKDLARVLEAKAEIEPDPKVRCQLLASIGKVRHGRGDVDGAIAAYLAAITAHPGNREVFTAFERVCYKAQRWAAALQLYELAIADVEAGSRAYRLADLFTRKGQVQLEYLGQLEPAAVSFARVVELDAGSDVAVTALERIAGQLGDWKVAIDALERRAESATEGPRKLAAMRAAAQLAANRAQRGDEAARLHHRILALSPRDREALDALEQHYETTQQWAKLIDVLKMRMEGTGADAALQLATIRRIAQISEDKLRDVDVATEHYTRLLEQDANNPAALEALGRIYESTEQWAELIEITRRQIRVTTDRNLKALLYFKCGSVMEAKFAREEDAIRYYDAAIKTSASCMPAVHGLRDLYRRREDWPRVIETLEIEVKLWQEDKERAGVFAQIGRIYEQRLGDPARAMHYYDSALAVDPECVLANQALFDHHFDGRDWAAALPVAQALAQKAMREGDAATRSEFYRRRGVVLRENGDPRGAAESVIIALEIRPTHPEALDTLAALVRSDPDAFDFDTTLRELEKVYRKRDDGAPMLARVLVAQAALAERAGDLEAAGALYAQAGELASGDYVVLSALVDYYGAMRRWKEAVLAITRFLAASPQPSPEVRVRALLRRAEIHAEGEMNAQRAVGVLHDVIALDPGQHEAYYHLAQELYLLGRYGEARTAIERVIELVTAPGATLSAEALARYYYYKGRILDAAGDARSASQQYRRAGEYDPGYAPPALVLARRAVEAGDHAQAETLLIDAARAAIDGGGVLAAVPLQRGLARMLLATGDRRAAIEAYRGILGVAPDSAGDRVALAEIYAVDDPARAIHELRKVIDRDIRNAPAYRLLASYYNRVGEVARAARVHEVMDQLGYAQADDRTAAANVHAAVPPATLQRPLDDTSRRDLLVGPAAKDPLGELFTAAAAEISGLFAQPGLGERLVPLQGLGDPGLTELVREISRLCAVEVDVYVGHKVPGMAAVVAFPRRMLVLDRSLLGEPEASRRFLLGWALDAIRGGYALLLSLGVRQRRELVALLRALVAADSERPAQATEFIDRLPKRVKAAVDRLAGRVGEVDVDEWIDGMVASAKRGGLLACNDFAAATRMVARLAGETPDEGEGTVALGAVLGGQDLVRYYLSDDYNRLRGELIKPSPSPS
ncbi:MAG: tetratricopeptide repeat protein [Kofleriaceae bacterium]|nr:tetratricopeptide repeat protein [Kofleriaceae bacterium]